jgi:predicted NAD/FAD-binding protein
MTRIAIIGGGWSGLAAAVTLAEAGIPCTLFEAAKQLGGRARCVEFDGEALDNGQHILLGAYSESLRLLRLVHPAANEGDLLLRLPLTISRPDGIHLRASRLPAPLHLLAALATARSMTISGRIAAASFFARWRQRRFQSDPALTVAQLVRDQPVDLVEQLWQPLCIAALNTPIREASAQVFLSVLRTALSSSRQASDLLLPRIDLGALFPKPAAAFIAARGG